jgi:hypothetical protein
MDGWMEGGGGRVGFRERGEIKWIELGRSKGERFWKIGNWGNRRGRGDDVRRDELAEEWRGAHARRQRSTLVRGVLCPVRGDVGVRGQKKGCLVKAQNKFVFVEDEQTTPFAAVERECR